MTNKEALYKFICNLNSNKPNVVISLHEAGIIKELIERDTPKKPLFVELDSENKHHYVCPICNTIVNIGNSIGYNMMFNVFCKKCGQRLDWSNKDE